MRAAPDTPRALGSQERGMAAIPAADLSAFGVRVEAEELAVEQHALEVQRARERIAETSGVAAQDARAAGPGAQAQRLHPRRPLGPPPAIFPSSNSATYLLHLWKLH